LYDFYSFLSIFIHYIRPIFKNISATWEEQSLFLEEKDVQSIPFPIPNLAIFAYPAILSAILFICIIHSFHPLRMGYGDDAMGMLLRIGMDRMCVWDDG